MSLSVAELHPALYELFHGTADHLARQAGFCQRRRQLTGAVFAQALVFALLRRPDATLGDFAEFAADHLGVAVSPQAFDRRFSPAAAAFPHELFVAAFHRPFSSLRPAVLPLLRRFRGIYLRDATLVSLPPALAELSPGRASGHTPAGQAAAVKLLFEPGAATGALTGASVLAGLSNDKAAELAEAPLPRGALLLEGLGFFSGARLQSYIDQGVYVVTRIPAWAAVFDERGRRIDLVKQLRRAAGWHHERAVRLLHGHRVRVRLLAVRLPEDEAERRRQRVRREAKERGRRPSAAKLGLYAWGVPAANVPGGLLSAEEACVVRRVRWEVELVFKVFKSEGRLGESRSGDRWRVLCELYAKLLAQVVQNWALLAAGYVMLKHSARRAARRVRRLAGRLVRALADLRRLARLIARLALVPHRRCAAARRHQHPSTLGRLATFDRDCGVA